MLIIRTTLRFRKDRVLRGRSRTEEGGAAEGNAAEAGIVHFDKYARRYPFGHSGVKFLEERNDHLLIN